MRPSIGRQTSFLKLLKIINCHVSGISGSRHPEQQKLANTQHHKVNNERGLQSCQSSGKLASEQYPFTLMSNKMQNTANPTDRCTHRGSDEQRKRQEQQQQQQHAATSSTDPSNASKLPLQWQQLSCNRAAAAAAAAS
ncbi:hypothetical protein ACLKA6_008545 [Drosophila palustris]